MKLQAVKMGKKWWIVGDPDFGPYGPYDTGREAKEVCKGVKETFKNLDNHRYFTSDRDQKMKREN